MASSGGFDPVEFKDNIRKEWRSAADGWRRWLDVVEAPEGGQRHSARLVALADLRPGGSVLDVGGGYGEPSLTAARVVGADGHVVCTDISEEMLATARDRAAEAGITNVEFIARDAEELDFDDETPERYADFIGDVAPQLTTMLAGHPTDVQERVWGKITDAYRAFQDADGHVRTENQAVWVKGIK